MLGVALPLARSLPTRLVAPVQVSASGSFDRFVPDSHGFVVRRTHFLAISAVQQDASWYCVQYLSSAGKSVGVEKGLWISFWR